MSLDGRRPALTALAFFLALTVGASLAGPASAQSTKYKEAPALAEQVKAGKLPPVEQRLPEEPLVVPVVEQVGQYGGVWRRAFLGPADANNYVRVVYDALFRFSPDGAKIEPKIAAGGEPSADFKTWTIKLRKGAQWSDGAPFTADDIVFWYKDVLLNKDLTPTLPGLDAQRRRHAGARSRRSTTTTVRFTYKQPATLFLTALANQDGGDRTYAMFLPAHYLKKFHPTLHAEGRHRQAGRRRRASRPGPSCSPTSNAPPENPERPTMAAWVPASRVSDPGVHAEAQSLLRRRRHGRQPAALHRRGALHLLRRRRRR